MVFLNPAVLFGLLAASIPVLIHLFNLRKLKRIEFSTLAFLKELQKNKIRKIKLKQWLLLALRVLIILFLITAFARPTLEGVAIGGTTSAAKTTAVFILDDTYSMSVVDGKGSYFNQAKGTIQELLRQLQEGDEAALVLVSDKSKEEIYCFTDILDNCSIYPACRMGIFVVFIVFLSFLFMVPFLYLSFLGIFTWRFIHCDLCDRTSICLGYSPSVE